LRVEDDEDTYLGAHISPRFAPVCMKKATKKEIRNVMERDWQPYLDAALRDLSARRLAINLTPCASTRLSGKL
jgi:hypothetical protein